MTSERRGFTLIEVLFVVVIISTLAAIAVPNFLEAQVRCKVGRTRTDQAAVVAGLNGYFADHLMYPTNVRGGQEFFVACATLGTESPMRLPGAAGPGSSPFDPSRSPLGGTNSPTTAYLPPGWSNLPPLPQWQFSGFSLTCLTTPVAYVGLSLPTDQFADVRGTPFPYVNTGVVRHLVPEPWRDGTPARFLLLSWGPDTDQSGKVDKRDGGRPFNPVTGPFISYDPTNGSISDGDVFVTGAE